MTDQRVARSLEGLEAAFAYIDNARQQHTALQVPAEVEYACAWVEKESRVLVKLLREVGCV